MSDAISRHGTSAWLENMGHPNLAKMIMDEKRFPSTEPDIVYCKDCIKYCPEKCSCKNDVTDILGFGRHLGGDDFCSRGIRG